MRNPLNNDSLGKLILRLTVGPLILLHGVHKMRHLESLDSIGKMLAGINLPTALAYGVFLGEVIGPLMIILGLLHRHGFQHQGRRHGKIPARHRGDGG